MPMTPPVVAHPLPPIAGREAELQMLMRRPPSPRPLPPAAIRSAFACALHMHQPTIPAGPDGALISHLQWMFDHPGEGDNHNAEPFARCYRRLADLLPQLIGEGCEPRIMLDYSGNLLWGFEQMGRRDILEALQRLACDPLLVPRVEWLGSFWSHAVAPSTPIADLRLQIQAWQQHFAALFGDEALARVRGFSPPEMALPNDPDTLHAFVAALRDSGYRWLLVQEHSVVNPDGSPLAPPQTRVPNRLVARNRNGAIVSITALIKTQGSDTKLVGQMQPCAEALGLDRCLLAGRPIPALVAQIADGENGGVMMNEFPQAFVEAHRRLAADGGSGDRTVALNGSEYLDLVAAAGVSPDDFPPIQSAGTPTLDGSSWTNHISWVDGYAEVLEPLQALSARFHRLCDPRVAADPAFTRTPEYQNALLHLLLLETSCFRYWGQGTWTDYAREIQRRGEAALDVLAAVP
ncbi:MAG: glycosyl hydrolase family 57 [Prochlorococcaceae cyanobacterium]